MFDQLGGLAPLVANKTVAIKVNCTGSPESGFWARRGLRAVGPLGVIVCLLNLLDEAGARRIRVCESAGDTSARCRIPVEGGMGPVLVSSTPGETLELVNTISAKAASTRASMSLRRLPVSRLRSAPGVRGMRCVCVARQAQAARPGRLTLSMKNVFGMLPLTIYGTNAGVYEPGASTAGFRGEVMQCGQAPAVAVGAAGGEPGVATPRRISPAARGYRSLRARPIHLAIIDGIETMAGGEGPWTTGLSLVRPGVLIAGLNPVSTDAVGTAVMGFDPMAYDGESTFRDTDNMMTSPTRWNRDARSEGHRGHRRTCSGRGLPVRPLGAPTEVLRARVRKRASPPPTQ